MQYGTIHLTVILALGAAGAFIIGEIVFGTALSFLGLVSYRVGGGSWRP